MDSFVTKETKRLDIKAPFGITAPFIEIPVPLAKGWRVHKEGNVYLLEYVGKNAWGNIPYENDGCPHEKVFSKSRDGGTNFGMVDAL